MPKILPKMTSLDRLHAAARYIETDGDEGFQTASNVVGPDIAMALLIAHLRRGLGSMESFPPDEAIDGRVNEMLAAKALIP